MDHTLRFLAITACLIAAGCGTPDVNPPGPRANTGYVDFYTDTITDLYWDVKRAKEPGGGIRTVFSEYNPLPGNILRLAVPAGTNRFEIWFSNEVTTGAQSVEVLVDYAKVTPVHVTLTAAGSISVDSPSYRYRSTARATRRVSRVASSELDSFQIGARAGTPEPYRPKEQMPYWTSKSE